MMRTDGNMLDDTTLELAGPDPAEILRRVFGHPGFRGRQEEIIRHVVAGGSGLVLMPTGGGKSLCYQVPALCREGLGVVVSPLIALMEDQVAAMRQQGVAAAAHRLGEVALLGLQVGVEQQAGHADDGVHGRADFVAHVGEEI